MKGDVFITKLARGAVTSTLAACLVPQSHTADVPPQRPAQEAAFTDQATASPQGTQQGTNPTVVYTITQAPSYWDKHMEREFRKLALEEAKGTISASGLRRLAQLNAWRDQLLCPQAPEEVLLQIKRDRLLARTEELLNDYLEFQKATG
ncbi:exported hypothetical protein [Verrucomicrobia bacterium]|nr:exported hypothetical protein [Verrucomicrobiota bacterium]